MIFYTVMKQQIIDFLHQIGLYDFGKREESTWKRARTYSKHCFLWHDIALVRRQVATVHDDPYRLAVTPEHFRKQMTYLKENYNIIPLFAAGRTYTQEHAQK